MLRQDLIGIPMHDTIQRRRSPMKYNQIDASTNGKLLCLLSETPSCTFFQIKDTDYARCVWCAKKSFTNSNFGLAQAALQCAPKVNVNLFSYQGAQRLLRAQCLKRLGALVKNIVQLNAPRFCSAHVNYILSSIILSLVHSNGLIYYLPFSFNFVT